ncbi:MAG: hypothetical protein ACXABY_35110 [Candidatus Thorarchaeota archaeon]
MKYRNRTKLLVVMGFMALLVVGANSALAFPSQSAGCGIDQACHATAGTITVSTNATGTVNAVAWVNFTLTIDSGNGADQVAIRSGWEDNSNFLFSLEDIEDDSSNDQNAAIGEISTSITITPTTVGTFTIRIWSVSATLLGTSQDIVVDVAENTDTTPPPTTPTPMDPIEVWTMLMYLFPAVATVILVVLGVIVFRRASPN